MSKKLLRFLGIWTMGVVVATSSLVWAQTITTFDAPGAGTAPAEGTVVEQTLQTGEIVGFYLDANFVHHGYLRSKQGTFTTFDVPGAKRTSASAINPSGVISGNYIDANDVRHGFVRAKDGTITSFDPVGSA